MGVTFGDAHGSAKKSGLEYIKLEYGENEFRMVGELLPRYAYWKDLNSGGNTFSVPIECLSFDRTKEEFTNLEVDWFKHYFPDKKCVWSYVIQVIDKNGELKLCGLKKKLFDQIQVAAKELGDPTDIETGWPIIVEKKKTGPNIYNVEYQLNVLACSKKKGPISDSAKSMLEEELKPIDELIPRPTADQQKAFIEQAWINKSEKTEHAVDSEAVNEFDDDTPF